MRFFILFGFLITLIGCEKENNRPFGTLIEVPNEVNTIQKAVNIAQPFDTILLSPYEYFEWDIKINKPLFITSHFSIEADSDIINQTIINANTESRVFAIYDISDTLRMNGFTIKNGFARLKDVVPELEFSDFAGAGIYCHYSNIVLRNLIISDNYAGEPNTRGAGGGLYIDKSYVFMDNVKIFDNSSLKTGGAFYCDGSQLIIQNSKIFHNSSSRSGGGPPISIWESDINFKYVMFYDNVNMFEIYPEIGIFDCQGILDNVIVINDSIKIQGGNIEFKDCNIPGY